MCDCEICTCGAADKEPKTAQTKPTLSWWQRIFN